MALFNKLNDLARNIAAKTSEALDETRVRGKINAEKLAAEESLKAIGEIVYARFAEGAEMDEEMLPLLNEAKAHYDLMREAQQEVEKRNAQLEAERIAREAAEAEAAVGRECGACGAVNDEGARFCRECGAKLGEAKPAGASCPECGADNEADAKFCRECGARLGAPAQPKCPECGAVAEPGTRFCKECGYKLND